MKRRDLLKGLGWLPAIAGSAGVVAAPDTGARLLFVFLRGGYDAVNLLVPVASSYY